MIDDGQNPQTRNEQASPIINHHFSIIYHQLFPLRQLFSRFSFNFR